MPKTADLIAKQKPKYIDEDECIKSSSKPYKFLESFSDE